jgi:hypothetical protein
MKMSVLGWFSQKCWFYAQNRVYKCQHRTFKHLDFDPTDPSIGAQNCLKSTLKGLGHEMHWNLVTCMVGSRPKEGSRQAGF